MSSTPDDLHEWLSFEDPEHKQTWVFDVTFLTSNWSCIFGHGCKGILTEDATELEEGCCSYGAHFIDAKDFEEVKKAARRLTAEQWQFKRKARDGFTKVDRSGVRTTRIVEGACIFLNRPGFAGGSGCALHHGAVANGESIVHWKPDVCWQLPLRLQEHTDEYGHVTSIVREWKRRDWDAGGLEFHWWCTESPDAFVGRRPVYEYLREELVELVGIKVYDTFVAQLKARPARSRIAHPATRVANPVRRNR